MKYDIAYRAALAVATHHGFMYFPARSNKRPTTPHGFQPYPEARAIAKSAGLGLSR
jgi:hypothetical protein